MTSRKISTSESSVLLRSSTHHYLRVITVFTVVESDLQRDAPVSEETIDVRKNDHR